MTINTIPNLTPYPSAAPQRGSRETFRALADAKVAHDYLLVQQANQAITSANQLSSEINAKASETFTARDVAVAASVYANANRILSQSAMSAAQVASASASLSAGQAGAMLGINFGGWRIEDGELIVSHLSTTAPMVTNGELIIAYEAL